MSDVRDPGAHCPTCGLRPAEVDDMVVELQESIDRMTRTQRAMWLTIRLSLIALGVSLSIHLGIAVGRLFA